MPAKKLLNVGWTARATAKPPMPKPARSGLIATPRPSNVTSSAIEYIASGSTLLIGGNIFDSIPVLVF